MKKLFGLFLIVLSLLMLSGCGEVKTAEVKQNEVVAEDNQTTPQTDKKIDILSEVPLTEPDESVDSVEPAEPEINNLEEIEKYQTLLNDVNSTVKACEAIKDTQLKLNCTNDALTKQALRDSNPDLCKQIDDDVTRRICDSQFPETNPPAGF